MQNYRPFKDTNGKWQVVTEKGCMEPNFLRNCSYMNGHTFKPPGRPKNVVAERSNEQKVSDTENPEQRDEKAKQVSRNEDERNTVIFWIRNPGTRRALRKGGTMCDQNVDQEARNI